MNTSTNNNSLINTKDPTKKIDSITTEKTKEQFQDNTWGYSLGNDTKFKPIPTLNSPDEDKQIIVTDTAGSNQHNINFGAKLSNDLISGRYTNTVIFSATSNTPPYPLMQDMTPEFCATMTEDESIQMLDSRDGEVYTVKKLKDGNCWLAENLRLGGSSTIGLTPSDTNIASNWTLPASSTNKFSDNSTGYTTAGINTSKKDTVQPAKGYSPAGKIGVFYNYCAASAGTYCYASGSAPEGVNAEHDICPKGWRMPTGGSSGEYKALYTAYSSNVVNFQSALVTPLSGDFYDGSADYQGSYGVFWSSTRGDGNSMHYLGVDSSNVNPTSNDDRYYGDSVRCVAQRTYSWEKYDVTTTPVYKESHGTTTTSRSRTAAFYTGSSYTFDPATGKYTIPQTKNIALSSTGATNLKTYKYFCSTYYTATGTRTCDTMYVISGTPSYKSSKLSFNTVSYTKALDHNEYSQGPTSLGTVTSTFPGAYPYNGTPDNTYWYKSLELISFTINDRTSTGIVDTATFYVPKGTTWDEWATSPEAKQVYPDITVAKPGEGWYSDNSIVVDWYDSGSWYKDYLISGAEAGEIIQRGTYYIDGTSSYDYYGDDCCLEPGSQVMTSLSGETKNIEDVEVGDSVVIQNINTGERRLSTTLKEAKEHYPSLDLNTITLEDGKTLSFTPYHPIATVNGFRSLTNFMGMDSFSVGDSVIVVDDYFSSPITKIDYTALDEPIITYNMLIAGINDFYLEPEWGYIANGMLVHIGTDHYDDEDEYRAKHRLDRIFHSELYSDFDYDGASDEELINFLVALYKENLDAYKEYIKYWITAAQYIRYANLYPQIKPLISE